MKCITSITAVALLILVPSAAAYNAPATPNDLSKNVLNRRTLLAGLATAATFGKQVAAQAAEEPTAPVVEESVYFGVGCFWHIQHEFVAAERELLGRSDRELTSFTGYAGGNSADSFRRVCYHNIQQVADYGKMGHGEVVGMKLPADKIVDFAAVYFSLYNPKTLGECTTEREIRERMCLLLSVLGRDRSMVLFDF